MPSQAPPLLRSVGLALLLVSLAGCTREGGRPDDDGQRRLAINSILELGGVVYFADGKILGLDTLTDPPFAKTTLSSIESPFSVASVHLGNFENPADNSTLAALAQFPELEIVGLYGQGINDDGLSPLRKLQHVKSLSLTNTKVTPRGLAEHENLRKVGILGFSGNSVDDSTLSGIEKLTGVEHLQIGPAPNVSDEGLKHLASMDNLRGLYIARTPVTSSGLKYLTGLPNLRHLELISTHVDNSGVDYINQLKHLRELNIRDSRIDDEGVQRIKNALPSCKIEQ